MPTEQQVAIADKLYSARRTLRGICRDQYGERVTEWIAKDLTDAGQDTAVLWVLAATVELIEPDEFTPKGNA